MTRRCPASTAPWRMAAWLVGMCLLTPAMAGTLFVAKSGKAPSGPAGYGAPKVKLQTSTTHAYAGKPVGMKVKIDDTERPLLYKFEVKSANGCQWQVLRGYSRSSCFYSAPPSSGKYLLRCTVIDPCTGRRVSSNTVCVEVKRPPCGGAYGGCNDDCYGGHKPPNYGGGYGNGKPPCNGGYGSYGPPYTGGCKPPYTGGCGPYKPPCNGGYGPYKPPCNSGYGTYKPPCNGGYAKPPRPPWPTGGYGNCGSYCPPKPPTGGPCNNGCYIKPYPKR